MSLGEMSNMQSYQNLTSHELLNYQTYQFNYISSILTANIILMLLIVILLAKIAILLILIAIKAKRFILKVVAEGIVIDDVRPFATPTPSLKPNRSKASQFVEELIDDVRPVATPTPPLKPKRFKPNERLVE